MQGFSALTIDRQWAHLDSFVGVGPRQHFLAARYLLQLHLVEYLLEREIHYLHAGSALAVNSSIQYFQYLTGYDAMNLRVASAPL